MPDVFGLPVLSYWKAVGILVMAKLLFGNFKGKSHKKHSKRGRKHFRNRINDSCKGDFSKWEYYDKFWKEEGEQAFQAYVERRQNDEQ